MYDDGWVEQGGYTSVFTNTAANSGQTKHITLSIGMADIKYTTNITFASDGGSVSGYANRVMIVTLKSTTGFTIDQWANAIAQGTTLYAMWQVSGLSEVTPLQQRNIIRY